VAKAMDSTGASYLGRKHRERALVAVLQREHTDAKTTARKRDGIGAAYTSGATTTRQRNGV